MTRYSALLAAFLVGAGCAGDGSQTSQSQTASLPSTTATKAPSTDAKAPPTDEATKGPVQLIFFDSRSFDTDLSGAMRGESPEIVVNVPAGFSLNKIPKRVDRWLYSVKDSGGAVVARPEQTAGTRGIVSAVIDVVVSIFEKIDEMQTFGPSHQYDATLLYREDGTVKKVVFEHR